MEGKRKRQGGSDKGTRNKRGKYLDDEEDDHGLDLSSSEEELEDNEPVDGFIAEFNEEQQIMVWVQRKFEPNPEKVH
jgi:hypothetical protein